MTGAEYTIDPRTMDAIHRENDETNLIAEWWENEQKEMRNRVWAAEVWNFVNMDCYE